MLPISDDLENILTPMQLMTLCIAEHDGWELYFVRRDGLEVTVPIIRDSGSNIYGVIEADGAFNAYSDIRVRIYPEVSKHH